MTNSKKHLRLLLELPFSNKEKLFCLLRYLSAPFEALEKMVPKKGSILDIGCGHGFFDLILKSESKQRNIVGIDVDTNKITLAKKLEKKFKSGFTFKKLSLSAVHDQKFDYITMLDVDYLLDSHEKKAVLEKAKELLTHKGRLLIKTVVKSNSLGYYLGLLQELLTVRLVKKTFSQNNSFYFFTKQQYVELIKSIGFKIEKHGPLKKAYHPHYYFVVKK